jgi:EAL domain-containing protein (putative c-di-GMP-specific phosphodiesterase class I)
MAGGSPISMGDEQQIRVLIADDDPVLRAAIAALVHDGTKIVCVDAVGNAPDAIAAAERDRPDVALVDVRMPGGGAHAARAIKLCSPSTKVIALSAHDDRATVLEMLEAGAVGYLVKGASAEFINEAISNAALGKGILSAGVTTAVIEELTEKLSAERQAEEYRSELGERVRKVFADESLLSMVFQPICSLEDRTIAGMEALARFSASPSQGPDRWFADAGEVGLRTELELLAVRKALEQVADVPASMHIAINASPATCSCGQFHELMASTAAERIVIEITEHAPVDDYAALSDSLDGIRELGGRLSIDDVGAGFASMSHILRLSPNFIKLDKTLTAGIEEDRSQQALAAGLISFSETIGATIIAEGIEREDQISVLSSLGVPYGQGYHLSRPSRLSEQLSEQTNALANRLRDRPRSRDFWR